MFVRNNRKLGEGASIFFDPETFAAFFQDQMARDLVPYVEELGNIENWATQIIQDSGAQNFEQFVYGGPETIPAYDPTVVYAEPPADTWIPQGQHYVENGMVFWTPEPQFANFTDPLIPSLPPVVEVRDFARVVESLPPVVEVQDFTPVREQVFAPMAPVPLGPAAPALPPANFFAPVPQIPAAAPAPAPTPVASNLPTPAPTPVFTPPPSSGSGPTRSLPGNDRPAPITGGILPGEGGEGRAGILDVTRRAAIAPAENRGWVWLALLVAAGVALSQ